MASRGFIDRAIRHLLEAESHVLGAEQDAARSGLLQRLDPRIKVVSALLLLFAVAATHDLRAIGVTLALVTLLAAASSLTIASLALRVWLPTTIFTALIASPALFTTAGATILTLPRVGWTISEQGLRTASFLSARVLTGTTIAYVLVVSTTWPRLLAALRRLRVPAPVVVLIGMTWRYIHLLVSASYDMLLSRRSRSVGVLSRRQQRSIASAMTGSLLLRTLQLSNDVHLAMQARGFRGSFDSLDTFRARRRDALALAIAATIATFTIWSGR